MWLLIFFFDIPLCLSQPRQRGQTRHNKAPFVLSFASQSSTISTFYLQVDSVSSSWSCPQHTLTPSLALIPFIGGLFLSLPLPFPLPSTLIYRPLPCLPSLPPSPHVDHSSQGLSLAPLPPELPDCMPPSHFFFSLYCFSVFFMVVANSFCRLVVLCSWYLSWCQKSLVLVASSLINVMCQSQNTCCPG